MSLGNGKPQFTVTTRVDGKLIRTQEIHDPFIRTNVTVGFYRWEAFKMLFRRERTVKVDVNVDGTPGAIRQVMMLDEAEIEAETERILADAVECRKNNQAMGYYAPTEYKPVMKKKIYE